MKTSIA